ncbi:hypothetical protein PILCRDRAFT_13749 [Piloderma croceum F 1598]|uniref:Uncharacterized protein n=1 Tax=Piloderma croceum (strain F 1598) TaxID=765440 RepID=A0A0C3F5P5_PILCF|nr:hypothetical protein PILCRDRAFT_13749 [Piloderma croceum F 1598]
MSLPSHANTPDSVIDPVLLLMSQIQDKNPEDHDEQIGGIDRRSTSPFPDDDDDIRGYELTNFSSNMSRDNSAEPLTGGGTISELCRQLKRRKNLSPESEAELDVYAVHDST